MSSRVVVQDARLTGMMMSQMIGIGGEIAKKLVNRRRVCQN